MDESDRESYIKAVQRESSTIGVDLPETIKIGDETLALSEFLIETRKVDGVPPAAAETIDEAKRSLREERRNRFERLENDPIDHERAEQLVEEINGLDRALTALENIRRPSFGDESHHAQIDDYERWLGFLDTVN